MINHGFRLPSSRSRASAVPSAVKIVAMCLLAWPAGCLPVPTALYYSVADIQYMDGAAYSLKTRPQKKFALMYARSHADEASESRCRDKACMDGGHRQLALVVSAAPNVLHAFYVDERYWKYRRRPASDGGWILVEGLYGEREARSLRSRVYRKETYLSGGEKEAGLRRFAEIRDKAAGDSSKVEGVFDLSPLFEALETIDYVCLIYDGNRKVSVCDREGNIAETFSIGVNASDWGYMAAFSASWPGFLPAETELPLLTGETLCEADTLEELLAAATSGVGARQNAHDQTVTSTSAAATRGTN